MTTRRHLLLSTVALPMLSTRSMAQGAAQALAFPDRAVTFVVPYSVGIGPDVVSRAVAAQLQGRWQQPVLVENRPGASGIVAFGRLRRTPADGHTLYLADSATLAINPLLHTTLPYDPDTDLQPLTLLFQATFMLFTSAAAGRFPTLQAMLDAARATPGAVRYAALGNGHPSQLAVEAMAQALGLRMEPVHFRDAGTLMSTLASGAVDFTAISMNTVAGLVAAGRLRPLAVGAARRLPAHPEIPTLAEAGGPAMTMHPWAALAVRQGTPAPLLAALERDLAWALDTPDVRQVALQAGFDITPSSPQAVRARAAADVALYAPLLRDGRVERMPG
jgi:tripartite-type tricarboxylate transporter receptor subunit TctC